MKKRPKSGFGARLARLALIEAIALGAICLFSVAGSGATADSGFVAHAQAHLQPPAPSVAQKEKAVAEHAAGPFDVRMEPQGESDKAEDSTLGRFSLDKQYHGDLEATAKGASLTAMTDVKGSAGYVAIERVTGTLKGRSGSFVLQHTGTMAHGDSQLSITVVPDSGTGQLVGIAGKMTIIVAAGKHSYEFDCTLPAAQ